MLNLITLISSLIAAISVSIVEPVNGETYDGDWLTVRAIVENGNQAPDSVLYNLNGVIVSSIPRLNSNWSTYMRNQSRNGYTQSVGPSENSILWTAPVTSFFHTFQSCIVVDDIVYYCEDSLYAFYAATGEVLWSHPVICGDDAPLVAGDRLFWASDSIYCFDIANHELEWVIGGGDSGNSNPTLYNGKLYCAVVSVGAPGTIIKCLDSLDGSQLWQKWYSGKMQASFSVWDDKLIFPTSNGPLYAVDPESGVIIWENSDSEGGYWDTSPCVVSGVVFIGGMDSHIRAVDTSNGETLWSTEIFPSSSLEATPAFHDGIVVCGNQSTFFAVAAEDGHIIWQINKNIHGSPAIANDVVYWGSVWDDSISSYDSLYAANLYTGEILWSYLPENLGWPLFSTPAIADGVLYYPAANGYLYAFGTGLQFTYLDDLFPQIGSNELIVTSWDNGIPVAADTVNFTVTQTGITRIPSGKFNLSASPNPTCGCATVSFELDAPGMVSVRLFDLSGRRVLSVVNQEMESGAHSVEWNGYSDSGQPVSSGLYWCRIECEGVMETTGLCVLR